MNNSSVIVATFQEPNTHMWLVAAMLESKQSTWGSLQKVALL